MYVLFESFSPKVLTLHAVIVYRVNWFRAKARQDRWQEAKAISGVHMSCTIQHFEKKEQYWQDHSIKASKEGYKEYALREANMWAQFASQARELFKPWQVALHM